MDSGNKLVTIKDLEAFAEEIKKKFYSPSMLNNNNYPKGTILLTYENVNPSTYIGGVWEEFGKGRMLVGVDTSQTEFNSVGKTGGGKNAVALGAVGLTQADGNFYTHRQKTTNNSYTSNNRIKVESYNVSQVSRNITTEVRTLDNNNNILENALPPYITVYMWRRTDDAPIITDVKNMTVGYGLEVVGNVIKEKEWQLQGTIGKEQGSSLVLSTDDWKEMLLIQSVTEDNYKFNHCETILRQAFEYNGADAVYALFNYGSTTTSGGGTNYGTRTRLQYNKNTKTLKTNFTSTLTWVANSMQVYIR